MGQGDAAKLLPVKVLKDGTFSGDSLVTAQELDLLQRHIDRMLLALGRDMCRGDVTALPYAGSVAGACSYCDYRLACPYNPETDGVRYLEKQSNETVFARIEEVERDG